MMPRSDKFCKFADVLEYRATGRDQACYLGSLVYSKSKDKVRSYHHYGFVRERKQIVIKECQLVECEPVSTQEQVLHEDHVRYSKRIQSTAKRSKGANGPSCKAADENGIQSASFDIYYAHIHFVLTSKCCGS